MTSVVNKYKLTEDWYNNSEYVYIGRGSLFGNGVVKGKQCQYCNEFHMTGGSTLSCYKKYEFDIKILEDNFHNAVLALKDKILVCFCKPNPCHGDILAEYCNNYYKEGVT